MIKLDTKKYEIIKDGRERRLSLTEYKIFCLLAGNSLVTYEDIAKRIYNGEVKYYRKAIAQRINSIRRKLNIEIKNFGKTGYKTEEEIYVE